jgi:hypothetical protein
MSPSDQQTRDLMRVFYGGREIIVGHPLPPHLRLAVDQHRSVGHNPLPIWERILGGPESLGDGRLVR